MNLHLRLISPYLTEGETDIVENLYEHHEEYGDFKTEKYYNIKVFKQLVDKI